ncbi:unnamed protein product, partial [Nesidiocoris tenuis]
MKRWGHPTSAVTERDINRSEEALDRNPFIAGVGPVAVDQKLNLAKPSTAANRKDR